MGRDLTQEDVKKYSLIIGCVLIIILAVGIIFYMMSGARTIKVDMSVGDVYSIVNVMPDEDIDMNELDGVVTYTIVSKQDNGMMSFDVTAEKRGKITLNVKDSAGNKYKYKIRISE